MKEVNEKVELMEEELEEVDGGFFAELGLAAMLTFGGAATAVSAMNVQPVVSATVDDVSSFANHEYTVVVNGLRARSTADRDNGEVWRELNEGTKMYVSECVQDGTRAVWGHTDYGWVCLEESDGTQYAVESNDVSNYYAAMSGDVSGFENKNYEVVVNGLRARSEANRETGDIWHVLNAGTKMYVSECVQDSTGAVWGHTDFGWSCLQEADGTQYAKVNNTVANYYAAMAANTAC